MEQEEDIQTYKLGIMDQKDDIQTIQLGIMEQEDDIQTIACVFDVDGSKEFYQQIENQVIK